MRILQVMSSFAAVGFLIAGILIGSSMAREVDEALGTNYDGIWNSNANTIWNEHERLVPMSRKRVALAGAFLASAGFFIITFLGL
ncbi:MAG TPA: hypothetical protein VNM47_10740 [Terriglobia bacterium]|nr:hypothetical protein [Terriglobia bacterium]